MYLLQNLEKEVIFHYECHSCETRRLLSRLWGIVLWAVLIFHKIFCRYYLIFSIFFSNFIKLFQFFSIIFSSLHNFSLFNFLKFISTFHFLRFCAKFLSYSSRISWIFSKKFHNNFLKIFFKSQNSLHTFPKFH